jgi:hypothetical protein
MRNYKRKSEKALTPMATLEEGAKRVLTGKESCRSVAKQLKICHVTLFRFIKKQSVNVINDVCLQVTRYGAGKQVFSDTEESILAEYIKTSSSIYFGLSPREVRKLAFQCATTYTKVFPPNWHKDETAGLTGSLAF